MHSFKLCDNSSIRNGVQNTNQNQYKLPIIKSFNLYFLFRASHFFGFSSGKEHFIRLTCGPSSNPFASWHRAYHPRTPSSPIASWDRTSFSPIASWDRTSFSPIAPWDRTSFSPIASWDSDSSSQLHQGTHGVPPTPTSSLIAPWHRACHLSPIIIG